MLPSLVTSLPGTRFLNYGNLVNPRAPLNRGLVSWWLALPQRSGGPKLFDIAGRNHGTLTNGPTWSGPFGRLGGFGTVKFDGTDEYLTAGIPSATLKTICLWYYAPASIAGNPIVLVQGQDAFSSAVWDWGIYHSSSTTLVFHTNGNSNVSGTVTAGSWNHLAFTRNDISDTGDVYINGRFVEKRRY